MCIESLQLSKFFVPLLLKFFEAVQDAPQHQQQKPPRNGGLKQQRRGRGLAVTKYVHRSDAGNGDGERAKVLHGGAADAETARSRRTGRSKQNGTRGRETNTKAA